VPAPPSPFSHSEYETRVARTVALLSHQGWDGLLCYASAVMPGPVRYLTGYETRLRIHDACYFLMTPGAPQAVTLFTNASWEHPEEFSWVQNVVVTSQFDKEIAARLPAGTKRLAVAGYRYLPLPVYLGLRESRPEVDLVDGSTAYLRTRMVKSPAEMEVLRRCAQITDCAGRKFLELVREGAIERDLAAAAEYAMKSASGDEVSFTTQVGRGERTSRVVIYPGDGVVQSGDPVQLDCGATHHGYRGDLSRVAVAGKPDPEYLRMLIATEEMYDRCLAAMRPGVRASDVARVGINVAKAHGLEEFLYRSPNHEPGFVGHGIGCHYSEPPELHPEDDTVLEENMAIVVEPILMRPGVGGVKIEDLVAVTRGGTERFSSCPIHTWNNG
jgi:Xaa-Pro aminopeptidase